MIGRWIDGKIRRCRTGMRGSLLLSYAAIDINMVGRPTPVPALTGVADWCPCVNASMHADDLSRSRDQDAVDVPRWSGSLDFANSVSLRFWVRVGECISPPQPPFLLPGV